jgi:hypothetical protein
MAPGAPDPWYVEPVDYRKCKKNVPMHLPPIHPGKIPADELEVVGISATQ